MASADYEVSSSLNHISGQIAALGAMMEAVHQELDSTIVETGKDVNEHIIYSHNTLKERLAEFKSDFDIFVLVQKKANRLQVAETRLVKIRQEIEKKFGHYDIVRRTLTGILQADDLNIVKASTITNVTEELMITTPNYWLAPALVALAAWINDQEEVAKRALKEAIYRDDAKTSLLFALICRRAGDNRIVYTLKWVKRFLENQDAAELDRETLVILDAYTAGLFGNDEYGIVISKIKEWVEDLARQNDFERKQIDRWTDAILRMKPTCDGKKYPYLQKYSKTYPELVTDIEFSGLNPKFLVLCNT